MSVKTLVKLPAIGTRQKPFPRKLRGDQLVSYPFTLFFGLAFLKWNWYSYQLIQNACLFLSHQLCLYVLAASITAFVKKILRSFVFSHMHVEGFDLTDAGAHRKPARACSPGCGTTGVGGPRQPTGCL